MYLDADSQAKYPVRLEYRNDDAGLVEGARYIEHPIQAEFN